MQTNLKKRVINKIEDRWRVVLFSIDNDFSDRFIPNCCNLFFDGDQVDSFAIESLKLVSNLSDRINRRSIINIFVDDKSVTDSEDLIRSIRINPYLKGVWVVLWLDNCTVRPAQEFIDKYPVNDIRYVEADSDDQFEFVLLASLKNQKILNDLLIVNKEIENKVIERTQSLSNSNTKLQSFVIKNSNNNSKLQQQKVEIEKQKLKAEQKNIELEKAFKKSSKHHIQQQKLLKENEAHRIELQKALAEIREINEELSTKNEEIGAQRDHIIEQREEIEVQRDNAILQHEKIAAHQLEIEENIVYARRIQQALLPPNELVSQIFPNHFIFNRPKDVVSGDFYWISQNKKYSVIAVADCTGHGISGAMMSMLGTAFLNEIVNKDQIICSSDILNQLRERITSSLHQSEYSGIEHAHDGIDISICIIDIIENKMEYSGANNPIYIFRDKNLIELKPDRMPIGIYDTVSISFTSQTVQLLSNDFIYMFSDGFADQFGGKNGKKLKFKRFKDLLSEIHIHSSKKQLKEITYRFEKWTGDNEQVDDVLIFGFKIF